MGTAKILDLGDESEGLIVLSSVFPKSPIVLVSAFELEDDLPLTIEGPEFQLDFLAPYISAMLKARNFSEEHFSWIELKRKNREILNLFYRFGFSLRDRLDIVSNIFRRKLALYSGIELALTSEPKVVFGNDRNFSVEIGLPAGIKNGTIKIPESAVPTAH